MNSLILFSCVHTFPHHTLSRESCVINAPTHFFLWSLHFNVYISWHVYFSSYLCNYVILCDLYIINVSLIFYIRLNYLLHFLHAMFPFYLDLLSQSKILIFRLTSQTWRSIFSSLLNSRFFGAQIYLRAPRLQFGSRLSINVCLSLFRPCTR